MKIALVACTKSKIPLQRGQVVQAQDLYTDSDWFQKARAWVECLIQRGELQGWAILSAKYGLVLPWTEIPTYDDTLSGASKSVRQAWASRVAPQLEQAFGPHVTYYVLAGNDYRGELLPLLPNPVEIPMKGLGIGDQKKWLGERLTGCLDDPTDEDLLAEDRIRRMIHERILKLERKGRQRSREDNEQLQALRSVSPRQIRERARVRCFYCGADPRAMEYLDVIGRELINTGCCPAGAEELARWLGEASTADRLAWAQAVYGPYLEGYGEIAAVTGPYGEVEARRRGEWEATGETADPYSISYGLDVRVVRDSRSLERATAFVKKHHAHMPWAAGSSWKFGVMVYNGPDLVAVAHVQQPNSRMFPQDGTWLEVARVAIRRDMQPWLRANAASLIYSAAWRAAREGTWVSDDEWARIKKASDKKRQAAEKKSGERSWRVQRRAERMITYTLADEELGTTLKAAAWEPAAWSPPHKKPSGARSKRGQKAGEFAKIRWQIGLKVDRRRILRVVDRIETKTRRADVVEVANSRRGPGGLVRTLLPSVYGLSNEQLAAGHYYTWEETQAERKARPKGARRMKNPADEQRRRLERGPQDPGAEIRVAYEKLRQGRGLTPRELALVLREWVTTHRIIDVFIYDQERWQARGEQYGNDAPLTLVAEGLLNEVLNYASPPELFDEFDSIVRQAGYEVHPSYSWAFHFYPRERRENPSKKGKLPIETERRIWDFAEEFLRNLDFNLGQAYPRKGIAIFFTQDWLDFSARAKPGSRETVKRRFEHWKREIKQSSPKTLYMIDELEEEDPVLGDWARAAAVGLLRDRGFEDPNRAWLSLYFIRLDKAERKIKQARKRPGRKGRSRALPAESGEVVRESPIKSIFEVLGIPYGGKKLQRWAELGMPVRAERRGSRDFYFGDLDEIHAWVISAAGRGLIADPFERKIPIEEAAPRLNAALEKLGISKARLAQFIGSTPPKIMSYTSPPPGLRSVPAEVVEKAEALAEQGVGEVRRHVPRRGAPEISLIRQAIERSHGNLSAASRWLKSLGWTTGVTPSNLSQIARRYDIPYAGLPEVAKPTPDELRVALAQNDYNLTKTADSFEFSHTTLRRLIDEYGLGGLVERFGRGSIGREDLAEAAEIGGFDTRASAEALQIHPSHFRKLLKDNKILKWFDYEASRRAHQARADEVKRLLAAFQEAVDRDWHRGQLAESLGVERGFLESRVNTLGIKNAYRRVRQDPGLRSREPRPVEPQSEKLLGIPFWRAALRDLRSDKAYAGRGGGRKLAKKIGVSAVSLTNWLKGVRVPGPKWIKRIMEVAGSPVPDWQGRLQAARGRLPSTSAVAREFGISAPHMSKLLAGKAFPSDQTLELILGPDYYVEAVPEPETGARAAAPMGEVQEAAATATAQAVVELLKTYRSQRELAEDLGVSPAAVSRYARGQATSRKVGDRLVKLYKQRVGEAPKGIASKSTSRKLLKKALDHYPSQSALAQDLGLTRGHFSRIVSGQVGISNQVRARLIELLEDIGARRRKNPPLPWQLAG